MFTPGTPGWPRPESLIAPESVAEPWGLTETQIEDPDGIRIVLVDVPAGRRGHPVRQRGHASGIHLPFRERGQVVVTYAAQSHPRSHGFSTYAAQIQVAASSAEEIRKGRAIRVMRRPRTCAARIID